MIFHEVGNLPWPAVYRVKRMAVYIASNGILQQWVAVLAPYSIPPPGPPPINSSPKFFQHGIILKTGN